jgi:hypothetical protein
MSRPAARFAAPLRTPVSFKETGPKSCKDFGTPEGRR